MNNKSNSNSSIGFTSLLQLAFIILKLCKVINLSQEVYYIKYCGKHTHEFCKEWEAE